jgi:hypothetical protein
MTMALAQQFMQHKPASEPPPWLQEASGLYRPEVGNHLPTSPQDLASKRAQDPPKMDKISKNLLKKSIKKSYIYS